MVVDALPWAHACSLRRHIGGNRGQNGGWHRLRVTLAGDLGREVGAIRAATTQIGYLIGSLVGGIAIAIGGFGLLSVVYAALFLAATLPYVCLRRPCWLEGAVGTAG